MVQRDLEVSKETKDHVDKKASQALTAELVIRGRAVSLAKKENAD